eukprot:10869089-Prorocentrum_lima.AAC.1
MSTAKLGGAYGPMKFASGAASTGASRRSSRPRPVPAMSDWMPICLPSVGQSGSAASSSTGESFERLRL